MSKNKHRRAAIKRASKAARLSKDRKKRSAAARLGWKRRRDQEKKEKRRNAALLGWKTRRKRGRIKKKRGQRKRKSKKRVVEKKKTISKKDLARIHQRKSRAAKLGWKRRKEKHLLNELRSMAAYIKRSEAAKKGWIKRKRRIIAQDKEINLRDLKITAGSVKYKTKREEVLAILGSHKLRDSDRVYAFSNPDGSVDGEMIVPTTDESVDRDIIYIGEDFKLPSNMWISVGIHALVLEGYMYRSASMRRPSDPIVDVEGIEGMSAFYTNWYPSEQAIMPFIVSRALAEDQLLSEKDKGETMVQFIIESDKVGKIKYISVRVHWNRSGNPPQ